MLLMVDGDILGLAKCGDAGVGVGGNSFLEESLLGGMVSE